MGGAATGTGFKDDGMSQIERAYRSSRFGQLHYRIARPDGPPIAPPLVCLHQTPSSGGEWASIMPIMARDRVVIAPDNPGYGMSDAPPSPATIPDFGAVVAGLMDNLAASGVIAGDSYDVIGMHTGSIVASELGLADAARVRRIVMISLAAYPADVRAAKLADLYSKFPAPAATLAHVEQLWSFFVKFGDPRMTDEARHVALAECLRLGNRMPWGYEAVYRYDFEAALDRLEQPVLVINPQDDLWDVTLRHAGRLRHGERWDLPGRAHGFLVHEAEEVAARVREFLA
jgi:pimeloyl-ACP methyl ester carboxylesterase